jgi:hypothetical protein
MVVYTVELPAATLRDEFILLVLSTTQAQSSHRDVYSVRPRNVMALVRPRDQSSPILPAGL